MIEVNEKHESGGDDNFGLSARKSECKNKNPFCKLHAKLLSETRGPRSPRKKKFRSRKTV